MGQQEDDDVLYNNVLPIHQYTNHDVIHTLFLRVLVCDGDDGDDALFFRCVLLRLGGSGVIIR